MFLLGGRATSRCGKRPYTWAAQKTSWAWHQMRCCQASETSGQSRGAVGPGQPWRGSTSTGSDNSIWGPKTSRATSPVRCKHTAIPITRVFVLSSPGGHLGRKESARQLSLGPSHSLCLASWFLFCAFFLFLASVSFSAGLILTRARAYTHSDSVMAPDLLGFFQSAPPLCRPLILFPKSVTSNSWPRMLKPLTSSLQNLLGIRWGHLCPFPCEGADLSQEVYFQHSYWSGTRSHFHDLDL